MELKDLLSKMAEYDEMEQPDGMNIAEEVKTFDDQKRVYSSILQQNFEVKAFADGIGIGGYTYSKENAQKEEIDKAADEIYGILKEGILNIDERINNVLKENNLK